METFNHSQGLGSDRLRKAIERNRAKQAKRESIDISKPSIAQDAEQVRFSSSLREGPRKPPAPVSYSRKSTALVRTKPAKSTARSAKPKRRSSLRKPLDVNDTVVKVFWAVCGVLVLRLIFSQGGVIDFYDRQALLDERHYEMSRIQEENKELRGEIDLIKSNNNYQKKLVREHLGFIAADEFLILFSKDSKEEALLAGPRS